MSSSQNSPIQEVLAASLTLGAVTLNVQDLASMKQFYADVIGLDILTNQADRITLGFKKTPLVILQSSNLPIPHPREAGLYHVAILFESQRDLAHAVKRVLDLRPELFSGSGDHHGDPNAAVVGPTGLVYDAQTDSLFVASTVDNAIFSIAHVGSATASQGLGTVVYKDDQHLHGPLALAQAPNGNFLVTNGDAINSDKTQPSEIVEFTPAGMFVKQLAVDANQGGAFGLAIDVSAGTARFATVDDNVPNLLLWTIPLH